MLPDVYTRLSSYIKETNVKGTFWNCPLPNEKKNYFHHKGAAFRQLGYCFRRHASFFNISFSA